MDYIGFIVFLLGIPLGYMLEFTISYLYIGWTACRRNNLAVPFNAVFTSVLVLLVITLLYVEPTFQAVAGLVVGYGYRLGVDIGEWFTRLDNLRLECLAEKARLDKACRECYMQCLDKCRHVEVRDK